MNYHLSLCAIFDDAMESQIHFVQVCFVIKKSTQCWPLSFKLHNLGHAKTYHQEDQGSHSMHNVFMLKAKKKTFLQTLMW